jgi:hypothetical protein
MGFFKSVAAELVAGAILMVLVAVGGFFLKRLGPQWLGVNWAEMVPYVVQLTAAVLVIYVAILVLVGRAANREADKPVAPDTIVRWLNESGLKTFNLADQPELSMNTGFIYGKDTYTFNLSINKSGYLNEFLITKVFLRLPPDQATWWAGLPQDERNEIARKMDSTVGMTMELGFSILEVESVGTKDYLIQVEGRVPLDRSLTKPKLLSDVESSTRYLRLLRGALTDIYKERKDVPR